jgi:hypothetical protein
MTKIAGSGSGSISQRHGSADPDPDPHQNVMDPQHWVFDFPALFLGDLPGELPRHPGREDHAGRGLVRTGMAEQSSQITPGLLH